MSEATSEPGLDAKIAGRRDLIARAVAESVNLPNSGAWLRIAMMLAT